MHPSASITSLIDVERRADLHALVHEKRNDDALLPTWSVASATDIWWAHNSCFELIAMFGACFQDNGVSFAMECGSRARGDFIDVVYVGVDFRVELADEITRVLEVVEKAGAA